MYISSRVYIDEKDDVLCAAFYTILARTQHHNHKRPEYFYILIAIYTNSQLHVFKGRDFLVAIITAGPFSRRRWRLYM